MSMGSFFVQVLSGLAAAAILFLVSVGITLVFGAMRIINVAHGSFFMYGAFGLASSATFLPGGDAAFALRVVCITGLVTLLGAATEVLVLRRIYAAEHLSQLLATFAIFYILADLAQQIWGNRYYTSSQPPSLSGSLRVGDASFPVYSCFLIAAALVVSACLFLLLRFTMFGWKVRAAVEDPELLATTGTNVKLLSTLLFALGTGLAGLAGAIVAPIQAVTAGLDSSILVSAFIVSIAGGLGSVLGSLLGSILIGLVQAFGVVLLPQWSSIFIYVVLILVLAFRPSGLLGRA